MMAANPRPVPEADLQAYVDGRLPAEGCASVEAAMLRDPELAARVATLRAQNAALRDALDPVLTEPIPAHLLAAAVPPAQHATRFPRLLAPALGLAATLVVGIGVGWWLRDVLIERAGTPTSFARQAAFAHALYAADVNRPVEIWAAEEKRLVNWLTKRLGFQVHAPDLNAVGYALVGGRLVAGNEKPTALFMYENADKQRLSLQVRKQAAGPQRDRVPLRRRERRQRVLLDRRRLRLRAVRQRRSRAASQDRARRLRPARRSRGRRAQIALFVPDAAPAAVCEAGRWQGTIPQCRPRPRASATRPPISTLRRSSSISTFSNATST